MVYDKVNEFATAWPPSKKMGLDNGKEKIANLLKNVETLSDDKISEDWLEMEDEELIEDSPEYGKLKKDHSTFVRLH